MHLPFKLLNVVEKPFSRRERVQLKLISVRGRKLRTQLSFGHWLEVNPSLLGRGQTRLFQSGSLMHFFRLLLNLLLMGREHRAYLLEPRFQGCLNHVADPRPYASAVKVEQIF